jgi:hypothetical protein
VRQSVRERGLTHCSQSYTQLSQFHHPFPYVGALIHDSGAPSQALASLCAHHCLRNIKRATTHILRCEPQSHLHGLSNHRRQPQPSLQNRRPLYAKFIKLNFNAFSILCCTNQQLLTSHHLLQILPMCFQTKNA